MKEAKTTTKGSFSGKFSSKNENIRKKIGGGKKKSANTIEHRDPRENFINFLVNIPFIPKNFPKKYFSRKTFFENFWISENPWFSKNRDFSKIVNFRNFRKFPKFPKFHKISKFPKIVIFENFRKFPKFPKFHKISDFSKIAIFENFRNFQKFSKFSKFPKFQNFWFFKNPEISKISVLRPQILGVDREGADPSKTPDFGLPGPIFGGSQGGSKKKRFADCGILLGPP